MPSTYGILIKNGVNYSHDTAESISFDNTESGLTATNTQDAIDELTSMIPAGSGGHTIINDSGTSLAQKDNLQFKGVYAQNNGDNTEVDICRTMTKAQMEALSGESLKGFINTSDEPDSLPLTAEWVAYDSNTSVKEKIDEKADYIQNITSVTENLISCGSDQTVSYTTTAKGWYRVVMIDTGAPDVSLRVNGKPLSYLNAQGRYEMVVPLDSGVSLIATVVGSGAIYLHKFNF